MDAARRMPEHHLEIYADRSYMKDVVKGLLHTIFFHRYFAAFRPATHDVLDVTLPYVTEDAGLDTLVEQRANTLLRQLDDAHYSSLSGGGGGPHAEILVQFMERKRRKGWFTTAGADDDRPWETWRVAVHLTTARSEPEAMRNRRVMERSLRKAALAIVKLADGERAHLPPITTNDAPFPYQIVVR